MAGHLQDQDDEITGINVTPLVDVMLVLLIIFMVTATYIVNRSIEVSLPQAESGTTQVQTQNLAFVLDRDSYLFLDGKPISFAELPAQIALAKKQAKNPSKLQALISADQKTPHGDVIHLIDEVKKNGISEFAINVEAPAKPDTTK
jgi:biopolymer transport protein TolR